MLKKLNVYYTEASLKKQQFLTTRFSEYNIIAFKIVSFAHISCQDSSIGDLDFTLLFSKTPVKFPTIDRSYEELSFEQQKTKKIE